MKAFVAMLVILTGVSSFARTHVVTHHYVPHAWSPPPVVCGNGWMGPGGRYFWPGYCGWNYYKDAGIHHCRESVVVQPSTATAIPSVVVRSPVVTQSPGDTNSMVMVQNVWVDGCYVDQKQPNGKTVRVWQAGHYEQRPINW